MKTKIPESFYRQMFILVIPMAIQNLINVGVSSSDIIMLGKLNENAMSSVSIANQFQFVMSLLLFGIASGSTVLNAQYWGKKNIRAIEMILGISLKLALLISVVFAVSAFFGPNYVMMIFTDNKDLIESGSKYLRIVAGTYIIQSFTVMILSTLKSMEMVIISTVVYAVSFVINVVINYCLIFGKLGLPMMGVEGAATGTAIARISELLITVMFLFKVKDKFRFRIKDILFNNRELRKDFYKYASPIVVNELLWSMAMAASTAIYGHISENLVAANSVAQVSRQLFTVFSFGVSMAAAILVGKKIGEKKSEEAEIYADNIIKLVLKIGLVMSILLFISRGLIVNIFNLSGNSRYYLNIMLIVICFYLLAQAYTTTLIVGIFRAGGDTKYGMFVDVGSMWFGSLLLAFIGAFILHLSPEIVIVLVLLDEFIKVPFCYYRYKTKIWLKDITREGF